jgi:hypothetical protein
MWFTNCKGSIELPVTRQPRHRSRRAELPRRAPRDTRFRTQTSSGMRLSWLHARDRLLNCLNRDLLDELDSLIFNHVILKSFIIKVQTVFPVEPFPLLPAYQYSFATGSILSTWYSVYTSYDSFDACSPVWSVGKCSRASEVLQGHKQALRWYRCDSGR